MKTILVAALLIAGGALVTAGIVHSHTVDVNKERVSDGAYSPRDQSHFSDSGEHHSEFDHEAILGSHKDAEEYDNLEPEEAKRRLAILLGKMDLNGDKAIDRKELKAWILRSFKMLSEEEAQERLEDADDNDDGVVTWSEYLMDSYGLDEEDPQALDGDSDHLIEDDKALWKAADVNKDGVLDANEWVVFSHPEEHPSMIPIILEHTLRDKDTDKDGAISFQEFVGERAHEHDKEWLQVEKDKFDKDLDHNHNGLLQGSEILSWIVPSNEEIALEEVDHLFSSSDDNSDNILSFAEVLEHHDTFVGSEATDYGDHLHNIHQFQDEL